jgi:mono/diheme cytochrome c family protein
VLKGKFPMVHSVSLPRNRARAAHWSAVAMILVSLGAAHAARATVCPETNTGIALSPGFCASLFADNIGHARHLVVAPSGVVYVNTWSGTYYNSDPIPPGGFLLALKDTQNTGNADVVRRFGESKTEGAAGGTGIAIYQGAIYAEVNGVSNGTCAGCHGSDGKGSPVGADLTAGAWLWSDGSLEGISKTISAGVATPKKHLGAMPPMGGSPLSPADLKSVSAYVWAIGHRH